MTPLFETIVEEVAAPEVDARRSTTDANFSAGLQLLRWCYRCWSYQLVVA